MNTKQSDEARIKSLLEQFRKDWRADGISEEAIANMTKPVPGDDDEVIDDSELFDPRVAEREYEKKFGKKR
jgi:hypothetical protein